VANPAFSHHRGKAGLVLVHAFLCGVTSHQLMDPISLGQLIWTPEHASLI